MYEQDFESFGPFGNPGRGGFGPSLGGMFRAGRGMMEPAILHVLRDKPMHGYEIISKLEEKSHGMWRPSPGSVYPTLQLLEEKDQVAFEEKDGKKVYHLTEAGEAAAKEFKFDEMSLWDARADSLRDVRNIRRAMGESRHYMHKIYRRGTEAQKQELAELIARFRLDLERIAETGK